MATNAESPVWLSGQIQTYLNKIVFPIFMFVLIAGLPVWVLATTGDIAIERVFYFIYAFLLVASVLNMMLARRIKLLGYSGRELVMSDYRREVRIPFEQVESVDRVWWYRGQMVRVVFRVETPFGRSIYYLPKWGPVRWFWSGSERELREIIAGRESRIS